MPSDPTAPTDSTPPRAVSPFERLRAQAAERAAGPAGRPGPRPTFAAAAAGSAAREEARGVAGGALTEIVGVAERVRSFNESWGLATLWTEDRAEVKVTGSAVLQMTEGQEYRVGGRMKNHPKHGPSLEAVTVQPHLRLNRNALLKFMVNNFKGVGTATAEKYIASLASSAPQAAGDEVLETLRQRLLKEPWAVAEDIAAVTRRASSYSPEERDTAMQAFVERDLATKLGGLPNMREPVIKALASWLLKGMPGAGSSAGAAAPPPADPVGFSWARLVRDPYAPMKDVAGYGFIMADAIGKSVNIPRNAPARLAALVAHAVQAECETRGHTFLLRTSLSQAIAAVDPSVDTAAALEQAIDKGTIAVDDERIYPFSLLDHEKALAKEIADRLKPGQPLSSLSRRALEAKIQETAKSLGGALEGGLDPTQVQALANIASSRVRIHTLTAGPGCGKTALMEVLVKLLPGKEAIFCAPTGKGAKVLSNRIARHGLAATTIHSLLRGSGPGAFGFNERKRLDGDFLVVDEGAMPDLPLMRSVIGAAGKDMHVIILGDTDQLPSIGPGAVLRDLLSIPEIDHSRLSTTHRNSGGILDVVGEIRDGNLRPEDRSGVTFSHGLGEADQGFPTVMGCYLDAVSRRGIENVCLLLSRKKGEAGVPGWNTTYANARLRPVCNPYGEKIPGLRFHVGDRIIIRSNLELPQMDPGTGEPGTETERVVNGDTGSITSYEKARSGSRQAGARWLRLKLDDGRLISMEAQEAGVLDWSYALTVHSAQGSEYQEVIAAMTPGAPTFINRNMLFTAFSRPKTHLWAFGEDAAIRRIAATAAPLRHSYLPERIRAAILAHCEDDEAGEEQGGGEGESELDGARQRPGRLAEG